MSVHDTAAEGRSSDIPSALYAPTKERRAYPVISRLMAVVAWYPGELSQSGAGALIGASGASVHDAATRLDYGRRDGLEWLIRLQPGTGVPGPAPYELYPTDKFWDDYAAVETAISGVAQYAAAKDAFRADCLAEAEKGGVDTSAREEFLGAVAVLAESCDLPKESNWLPGHAGWAVLVRMEGRPLGSVRTAP